MLTPGERGEGMADCEFYSSCRLVEQWHRSSPKLAEDYGKSYCMADYSRCARYMVAGEFGPDKVPLDLLPFETDRANEAIGGLRKWSVDEGPEA